MLSLVTGRTGRNNVISRVSAASDYWDFVLLMKHNIPLAAVCARMIVSLKYHFPFLKSKSCRQGIYPCTSELLVPTMFLWIFVPPLSRTLCGERLMKLPIFSYGRLQAYRLFSALGYLLFILRSVFPNALLDDIGLFLVIFLVRLAPLRLSLITNISIIPLSFFVLQLVTSSAQAFRIVRSHFLAIYTLFNICAIFLEPSRSMALFTQSLCMIRSLIAIGAQFFRHYLSFAFFRDMRNYSTLFADIQL
jgi:hypothetical protein